VPLSITKTTGIKVWWASQKRSASKRFLASAFALPLFPASSMKKGIHAWGLLQKRALTKTRFLVLAFVLSLLSATLFEKRNWTVGESPPKKERYNIKALGAGFSASCFIGIIYETTKVIKAWGTNTMTKKEGVLQQKQDSWHPWELFKKSLKKLEFLVAQIPEIQITCFHRQNKKWSGKN